VIGLPHQAALCADSRHLRCQRVLRTNGDVVAMARVPIYDTAALTKEMSVIKTFACKDTEKIASGKRVKAWTNIERQIQRKIEYLKAAVELGDLRAPPGNRLEQLLGDRAGQHSIRVNDQYRICFRWEGGDVYDVEVTDYH